MELITIEQASQANDRIIGIFILIILGICVLMSLYVRSLTAQHKQKTAKAVAKALASERERTEAMNRAKGTALFVQSYTMRQQISSLTSEVEEQKALVKRLQAENNRLKTLMEKSYAGRN